jgi:ribonuclease BN (tRNA processing enzyme)
MTDQERTGIMQQAARGHLTPEAVGQMARDANVGAVVLTHLTYRPAPHTENYAPWADEVKRHFSGRVLIARDLMEY